MDEPLDGQEPDMRPGPRIRVAHATCAVLLTLTGAACGDDEGEPTGSSPSASSSPTSTRSAAATTPSTRTPSGTTITSARSDFGEVLWGPNRQAVYIWEKEPTATAQCYGDCAEAWPPVLTTGDATAGGKVDAALLGTTTRRDGSSQVTYNGHPLYYYAHEGPGEVKCHDVSTHGGLWWVITPAGQRAA